MTEIVPSKIIAVHVSSGCELLAFEGEVALVIGRRATRVSPQEAWSHVGWMTAANDFGVYDLRYADKGPTSAPRGSTGTRRWDRN